MFRLITHVITYNSTTGSSAFAGTGHQAVATDIIESTCQTEEELAAAKSALNDLARGIGGSGNSVGVAVRHVVIEVKAPWPVPI